MVIGHTKLQENFGLQKLILRNSKLKNKHFPTEEAYTAVKLQNLRLPGWILGLLT